MYDLHKTVEGQRSVHADDLLLPFVIGGRPENKIKSSTTDRFILLSLQERFKTYGKMCAESRTWSVKKKIIKVQ